ncbi:hypothetical protein DFH08DRAFT_1014187 [Mycena albidolilacea]|uniref:BTB domain-containing protein n=1 Tax=Mycena albidolilacea TaxID=1033008 RepID=A0AAD6ZTU6_9AGAR|nr:hypothetical protein DFH08DRAFT_1014187 [Mycena albidolilacea]
MGAPVTLATPVRTPARKRSPSKRLANILRSELWFADGNIIIIASSVAFKVHRGQLRRHSEVFDDLFSIPQPKDQDMYDGCPWVEVYDCPSDVLYFLRALYDGLYFRTPGANDFPAVAAVLRLSTKYLVEHLRQRCMARLEVDWPSTLAAWDQREQAATDAFGHYQPRASCPHPLLVIDLALALGPDLAHLLPAALYDLSRYGPSKILSGTPAPPLSLALPSSHPAYASHTRAARKPTLPAPALLLTTFRGREAAQAYLAAFISTHLHARAPAPLCAYLEDEPPARHACRESFYFIMLNLLRSVGGIACGRDADPLFTLLQSVEMLERTDFSDGTRVCGLRMCAACKVDFRECAGRAREEVWGLLPGWFGLEGEGEGRATQQKEARDEMGMDM